MRKLQEVMSHSDPRLTARYSPIRSEASREATERMERMERILKLEEDDRIREGYLRGYQDGMCTRSHEEGVTPKSA